MEETYFLLARQKQQDISLWLASMQGKDGVGSTFKVVWSGRFKVEDFHRITTTLRG
jgi:hypothetical protein